MPAPMVGGASVAQWVRTQRRTHAARDSPTGYDRGARARTASSSSPSNGHSQRYRGMQKTHFHHLATAMAITLQRFVAWVWEIPRSTTRQSHFARLALAT